MRRWAGCTRTTFQRSSSRGVHAAAGAVETANRTSVPLLRTRSGTPDAMARLGSALDNLLAPRTTLHGVLMDIVGLGVLVIGESGIGKSECALELVVRGHRLVADDVVELRAAPSRSCSAAPGADAPSHGGARTGHDQRQGPVRRRLVRATKRVELVASTRAVGARKRYESARLRRCALRHAGGALPMIRMPVAPGRNFAVLVEVAARNHLLRSMASTPLGSWSDG